MGKLVEGLWDCPFCDNKRIRAGQKTCPNCGHPQDENTKFYMPDAIEYVSEEKAAKISRNPDWQCSFCGSLNTDCSAQINLAGSQKENRLDVSIRHRFSSSAPDGNDRVAGL